MSPYVPRHPSPTRPLTGLAALVTAALFSGVSGGLYADNWSCAGASNGQWDCARPGANATVASPTAAPATPAENGGFSKGFHPIDTVMGWFGGADEPAPPRTDRSNPPAPAEAKPLSPPDVAAVPALEPAPIEQTPIPEPSDLNRAPLASATPIPEAPPKPSIATGTVAAPHTPAVQQPPRPTAAAAKNATAATKPGAPFAKPAAPVTKPAALAPAVAAAPPSGKGLTLQLMSATTRAGLDRVIQEHHLKDAWVIREQRQGQMLFILLLGRYANRDQAIAARDALPAALGKADPWIRDIAGLKPVVEGAR